MCRGAASPGPHRPALAASSVAAPCELIRRVPVPRAPRARLCTPAVQPSGTGRKLPWLAERCARRRHQAMHPVLRRARIGSERRTRRPRCDPTDALGSLFVVRPNRHRCNGGCGCLSVPSVGRKKYRVPFIYGTHVFSCLHDRSLGSAGASEQDLLSETELPDGEFARPREVFVGGPNLPYAPSPHSSLRNNPQSCRARGAY
jgi:hypothetical protein